MTSGSFRVPEVFRRRELWVPALLTVALVVFKLVFVVRTAYGPFWTDEIMYRQFAEGLLEQGYYSNSWYPLLYPLAIVPGLVSGDSFRNIVVLNAVYSSLVLVPTYLLAREVMDRASATLATLVVALLPFHLSYPRQVLSENLFYPLLVLAVWLFVRARGRLWASDLAAGAALGVLWLTRHVTVALVPALLLTWWIRELMPPEGDSARAEHTWSGRLGRFALVCGTTALTYAPWLIMRAWVGKGVTNATGFERFGTTPYPYSVSGLALWAAWYVAVYALIAAPVLGVLCLAPLAAWRERFETAYTHLAVATGLVGAALLVTVTRHSQQAFYNHPEPTKLAARYAMCLGALFIVMAFATIARVRDRRPASILFALWGGVVPAGLVLWGWWSLVRHGGMVGAPPGTAPDIGRIQLVGGVYFAAALLFYVVTVAVLSSDRWRERDVLVLFSAGVIALTLWGAPAYLRDLDEWQDVAIHGRYVYHEFAGQELPTVVHISDEVVGLSDRFEDPYGLLIFEVSARFEKRTLPIRGAIGDWSGETTDKRIAEVRLAEHPEPGKVLTEYEYEGRRFVLVERYSPEP